MVTPVSYRGELAPTIATVSAPACGAATDGASGWPTPTGAAAGRTPTQVASPRPGSVAGGAPTDVACFRSLSGDVPVIRRNIAMNADELP